MPAARCHSDRQSINKLELRAEHSSAYSAQASPLRPWATAAGKFALLAGWLSPKNPEQISLLIAGPSLPCMASVVSLRYATRHRPPPPQEPRMHGVRTAPCAVSHSAVRVADSARLDCGIFWPAMPMPLLACYRNATCPGRYACLRACMPAGAYPVFRGALSPHLIAAIAEPHAAALPLSNTSTFWFHANSAASSLLQCCAALCRWTPLKSSTSPWVP